VPLWVVRGNAWTILFRALQRIRRGSRMGGTGQRRWIVFWKEGGLIEGGGVV